MMESFSPVDLTAVLTAETIPKTGKFTSTNITRKLALIILVLAGIYCLLKYIQERKTAKQNKN